MRRSRLVLAVGVPAGVAAALVLIGVARVNDLKKWFVSQWGIPHGRMGWLFAVSMPKAMTELYGPAAEYADLQVDDELLDIGCGAGAFLSDYGSDVGHVAGLDVSEIQLRLARNRLEDRLEAGTAEIVSGDAVALPWEDNRFSVLTCLLGLEFFPDPGAALGEMLRVLRPGGRMVVTFGIDETDEACVRECDWIGWQHLPEDEVRKLVEDAGFAVVDITYPDLEYKARFVKGSKPV